jgi:hypothetical protein
MAPWGGTDKIVGINPLGIAFPAGEERPILLDIAFGATALAKSGSITRRATRSRRDGRLMRKATRLPTPFSPEFLDAMIRARDLTLTREILPPRVDTGGQAEIGFSRVSIPYIGEWHPTPPFFQLAKKGPLEPGVS